MPNQINNNPSDPKSWDYIAAAYDAAEIMLRERNKRLTSRKEVSDESDIWVRSVR